MKNSNTYSKIIVGDGIMMEREDFIDRLVKLRMNKGVSARDMSLSLGQNPGYINNIESGKNFPTMQGFFYICEYFQITPKEFFDTETTDPPKLQELSEVAKDLSYEQLDMLIKFIKSFKRTTADNVRRKHEKKV